MSKIFMQIDQYNNRRSDIIASLYWLLNLETDLLKQLLMPYPTRTESVIMIYNKSREPKLAVALSSDGYPFMQAISSKAEYPCDIDISLYINIINYFHESLVENVCFDRTKSPRRRIKVRPPFYPRVVRLYSLTEHRISLLECVHGDGFDLCLPSGKVIHCGVGPIVAGYIGAAFGTEILDQ